MGKVSQLLTSTGAAAGNGFAVLEAMSGLGTGLQQDNYFSGNYTYANILIGNGTEGFTNGGIYHDTDLWLEGVPAGTATVFVRHIVFGTNYFPPGAYIVGTKQGMICGAVNANSSSFIHITQQGIDSGTQSLRDATFTIDDLGGAGDYSGLILDVTVKVPAAGGLFNCKDLYVGLVSDYASWLAGIDSSATFRANNSAVRVFKDGDLVGMNTRHGGLWYVIRPDQLVTTTRSYQGTQFRSYGKIAKQIKELGTDAVHQPVFPYVFEEYWFSASIANNSITRTDYGSGAFSPVVVGSTFALYGGDFQSGTPVGGVAGGIVYHIVTMLSANEWQVSLTAGGAPVTITQDYAGGSFNRVIALVVDPSPVYLAIAQQLKAANPNGRFHPQGPTEVWNNNYFYEVMRQISSAQAGQPYNYGAGVGYRLLRIWKAMRDAGFSRSQVFYSVEGQNAGAGGFTGLVKPVFDYVSDIPGFHFGKTIREIVDGVSIASYPHFQTVGNVQIGPIEMLFNGAIDFTPSQWSPYVLRGIDVYSPIAAAFRTSLDTDSPNTPIVMYEGDPSDEGIETPSGSLDFMDKTVTAVTTGTPGSLTAATPFGAAAWITGLPLTILSTGTKPAGLTAQSYYWVHSSSTTTTIVLAATYAAAFGGAAVAITSAGTGTISVSVKGQQIIDLGTNYEAYKASSERAADWAYYLLHIVGVNGFKSRNMAVYSLTGNTSRSTTALRFYSQKRADGLADSPAMTFLKGYTGWETTP